MPKIGNLSFLSLMALGGLTLSSYSVFAAVQVEFKAVVDRHQVASDEPVTLKMTVTSSSQIGNVEPEFRAPDFQLVNSYNSISVHSYYNSNVGGLQVVNSQEITKVL